jgi:hypothetical protein
VAARFARIAGVGTSAPAGAGSPTSCSKGVGAAPERPDWYPFSFQLRRSLTDEEITGLDPTWLAIPAVDEGGTPEEVRGMLVELGILSQK